MAIFNEMEAPRYARFLQKLFGIKGGAPVRQVAGEIAASLVLFSGQELRYLEAWQKFGVTAGGGTPLAGNRGAIRLRNPAGSNVIAVIEKLTVTENTGADFVNFLYDAIATPMPTEDVASVTVRNLIPRNLQVGATCICSSSINFGALGTTFFHPAVPSQQNYELITYENQEIELSPGSQITVASNTLAQSLLCSFMWRERLMEESEKNLPS